MTDKIEETNVKRKVRIEFYKPDDFKQVYAIGAVGGHSPYDFRIGFYNDTPKTFVEKTDSQVIQRRIETEIILSPLAAMELTRWLNQHIKEYENVYGPIAKPPVLQANREAKSMKDSSDIQGYI